MVTSVCPTCNKLRGDDGVCETCKPLLDEEVEVPETLRSQQIPVVDGISFDVKPGEVWEVEFQGTVGCTPLSEEGYATKFAAEANTKVSKAQSVIKEEPAPITGKAS